MPSLWSFAGGGLSNYLLVIVSGFIFVVVALQLILSRVGRTKGAAQNDHNQLSLRDWAAGEFDTCQGRLSGAQAVGTVDAAYDLSLMQARQAAQRG
jgi:hypothetical protein